MLRVPLAFTGGTRGTLPRTSDAQATRCTSACRARLTSDSDDAFDMRRVGFSLLRMIGNMVVAPFMKVWAVIGECLGFLPTDMSEESAMAIKEAAVEATSESLTEIPNLLTLEPKLS